MLVAAKIVKAESRNKSETPFPDLVMPRRILFKTKSKIVKAESRNKSETLFPDLVMPRRILFKTKSKIVKAESRNKSETPFPDLVMPRRILFKTKSKTTKAWRRGKSNTSFEGLCGDYTFIMRPNVGTRAREVKGRIGGGRCGRNGIFLYFCGRAALSAAKKCIYERNIGIIVYIDFGHDIYFVQP